MPRHLFTPRSTLPISELFLHRFHATLGACVLLHIGYRYTKFFSAFSRSEDMALGECSYLPLFLIPHLLLQLTGFGFSIPRKRHPDGNRIWPEYRWHALVFFLRSSILLVVAYLSKREKLELPLLECKSTTRNVVNLTVIMVTMFGADHVTSHFSRLGESTPTIRGLNGPSGALYLMSVPQFHATVHCLLTCDRMSVQFAALTVVQTTAFGMTLRRKGIISIFQGLLLYAIVLALGMAVIIQDLRVSGMLYEAIAIANVAAILRMDLGCNKYLLWPLVTSIIAIATSNKRLSLDWIKIDKDARASDIWFSLSCSSAVFLMWSAIRRQCRSPKKNL